ncbi:MAG: glycosyltransferase family 2 protein [Candidatus Kerfeldbacteria bacterium]|nr:glycosyltransferase family 2 protein [Candidatus Kerfeldbacteria bacterium]
MKSVDIIIPAYNEAGRIAQTLRAWLVEAPAEWTITIALNGCTDNTHQVIASVQRDFTRQLVVLDYKEAIGKGGAIVRGWQQSRADIVGFVDADLSTSPAEMKKLVDALPGHDGVIASRFSKGATIIERQSRVRTLMSKVFALAVKILFGMPYSDTQCGAKVFTRAAVQSVLDRVHATNMAFDVELLWRLHQHDARIVEVPTYWVDRTGSSSLNSPFALLRTGSTMLRTLLHVRFSK